MKERKMHAIEAQRAKPPPLPKCKIFDIEVVAAWVVAVCLMVGLIII